jgi:SH3 domain-containing YSC84-like protein 1
VDRRSSACAVVLLSTFILSASNAQAQKVSTTSSDPMPASTADGVSVEANEAQKRVNDAVSVVRMMKTDPQVSELIQDAKGLLIVPHFIMAALVFGGQGGPGLMVVQRNGRWSDPAFYKTRSGSFGAQIGGAKGALVMILTSDKAVEAFAVRTSSWSLSAGAGLTATSYSKDTRESGILSDVVIWSDTKGLFGGAAVGATRVASDERANQAFYNHPDVTPQKILSGLVANPYSNRLREVLPMQPASK